MGNKHSFHYCPICGAKFGTNHAVKSHMKAKGHKTHFVPDAEKKMQHYHQDKLAERNRTEPHERNSP